MIKAIVVIVFILSVICYLLFSTHAINDRWTCGEFTHVGHSNRLVWEIPGFTKMFNPSIAKRDKGYVMCTRYSNKTVKNVFMYAYSELNYHSKICMAYLSPEMRIEKVVFPKINDIPLEDPRIAYHNGSYYVSITEYRAKKHIMPTLYKFDTNFNLIKRIEYNLDHYFEYTKPSKIQKNWCPFSYKGKLLLHTDAYPTWRVFQILDDGSMLPQVTQDTTALFNSSKLFIRCSTSWKPFLNDDLLCGLHTKQFCGIFPTIRTILVEIDGETLLPKRKTKIFCVDKYHTRIQFLSGMESDDLNIYLTYGIGDYKSEIKRIPKRHILTMLSS